MMRKRLGLLLVVASLVAGGGAVMLGNRNPVVSPATVLEIWADVLQDTQEVGFRLSRVSTADEMALGKKLAAGFASEEGRDPNLAAARAYVRAVGERLVPHINRKDIQYTFHVIRSSRINAFALPGGQVFILTGMLDFLESEAELAAVLGHEISHVDLLHCIERFQLIHLASRLGVEKVGYAVEIIRRLLTKAYSQFEELEADQQGVRLGVQAGYTPLAGARVFERLRKKFQGPAPKTAKTPVGGLTRMMGDLLVSYFRSHPDSSDRVGRLTELGSRYARQIKGGTFYEGKENHLRRIPSSRQKFPGESRKF